MLELQQMEIKEQVLCRSCGLFNDFRMSVSGPHVKAICNGCDRYIKFLKKPNELRREYKRQNAMADKIIKLKINLSKVIKEWFFKGEKGTYMDVTILYNEKPDDYGCNGMIVQDVPKEVYEKDKTAKGPILGNCIDWATREQERDVEGLPQGAKIPTKAAAGAAQQQAPAPADDLPF